MGVVDQLFGQRSWFIRNEDTGKELQGQFEPEGLTENIKAKYSKQTSLNRQNPVIQFISGEVDTVTFTATLWNRDSLFQGEAEDNLALLKEWIRRDSKLGRPPICSFWVGDGMMGMETCVVESLGGIKYRRPTIGGALKGVTLAIQLLRYEPFSLDGDSGGETRYHRARERDYYEMLTYREYGSALMGDIIRKRHPTKPNIQPADVIKLPSFEVLRKDRVEPKSIPFSTSFDRKQTAQRTLRLEMFEKRDRTYVSHIIKE